MNETETIVAALHECTTNDTYGNPRRCYTAISATGHILRVTDEGYVGAPEWILDLRSRGIWEVLVQVTPAQYRERVKLGNKLTEALLDLM